ncbi:MAG: hypothetical protein C5B49_08090 [Bdellovibrio sp.]|nr:MAG: hypothetical protein C5B49_08090 [Bdellovibrio sp.]
MSHRTLKALRKRVTLCHHIFDIVMLLCHLNEVRSVRTKYRNLAKQIQNGEVVRLSKGVYASPKDIEGIEGDFFRATRIVGKPSSICLISALKFYGLTEQMFGGIWILVPYARSAPPARSLRTVRSRSPHFRIGIVDHGQFRITDLERTIVDCFRYSRMVGMTTAVSALKQVIADGLTTRDKVYAMARRLRVEKKVIPYLESL